MQSETKFVELVIVNDNSQVSHVAGNKLRYFMCLLLKDQGLVSRKTRKLSGPKANFKTQTCWIVAQFLGHSQFCFGTDSFILLFFKIIKTLILNTNITNPKQLSGPEKLSGLSRNGPQICDPRFDFSTYPDEISFAKFEKLIIVDSEPVHLSVVY